MATEPEHWVSVLSDKIKKERKPPYVVASGITTSGPTHIGTASEFLYPNAVASYLRRDSKVSFLFIGDIMDAFDAIPEPLSQYKKQLEPELGKPLAHVTDPLGCHKSFGEHFLGESEELMEKLDVHPEILRNNDLYQQGKYDDFALIYLKNRDLAREVVFESSLREKEGTEWDMWNPILPICGKCGRISTAAVTSYDDKSYSYVCNKDVEYAKGCGYEGKELIKSHKYKILWRLEWPARQTFLNVTIEGAGKDHWTRGGSVDTAILVHRNILKQEPPFLFKYGFFTVKGKKYSKSKGIGLNVDTLIKLMPSEVIKYQVYKLDSQVDKEFDPNGVSMLNMYDDYEKTSGLQQSADISRADNKKMIAYGISGARKWKARFLDMLIYYQVYRDWNEVGKLLDDPVGVKYLSPFIEFWISEGYPPEEYSFSITPKRPEDVEGAKAFRDALKEGMDALAVHNLVFEVAKGRNIKPEELFKALYTSIIGKEKGPKLGKLISAIGIGSVKELLTKATS
jgi:lysyl-tRNA synthetase class 1